MTAKKLYKHFLLTNVFSIRDKIKEQRKKKVVYQMLTYP